MLLALVSTADTSGRAPTPQLALSGGGTSALGCLPCLGTLADRGAPAPTHRHCLSVMCNFSLGYFSDRRELEKVEYGPYASHPAYYFGQQLLCTMHFSPKKKKNQFHSTSEGEQMTDL